MPASALHAALRVLAQSQQQLREVRRHRALQGQALARARMIEAQRRGMQGLTFEAAQGRRAALATRRAAASNRPP